MFYSQQLLDLHPELIVEGFAGGGLAGLGIEMGLGRMVDVAINHDPPAVAMHRINHPHARHYVCDIFEVDPYEATGGRPVGLAWFSPDCTDHSDAKGGKPIRTKKRRALAWVVKRWAGQVRPRVIMLENVPEFEGWGPLVGVPGNYRRDKRRAGRTFKKFVRELEKLGYAVEWRCIRACDYGSPTIRNRLFMVARCDGRPIVWPEATHGPGRALPYRTVAECIDWSIPMCSIFATRAEARAWAKEHGQHTPKRPLAKATNRRLARGVGRYVLHNPKPYLVRLPGGGAGVPYMVPRYGERKGQAPRTRSVEEPSPVIVPGANGGSLAVAHLSTYYGGERGESRGAELRDPLRTQSIENRFALVAAFLAQNNSGGYTGDGRSLRAPNPTILASGSHQSLVAAHLTHNYTSNTRGGEGDLRKPLKTVVTANHAMLVAAFLQKYYGQGTGQGLDEPAHTIPTKDRMGLVTVEIDGQTYAISDIAMRMLQPRELYRCQGAPDSYVIDRGLFLVDGKWVEKKLTKTEQVRMVGNSVCPDVSAALTRANLPELIVRDAALPAAPKKRRARPALAEVA